MRIKVWNFTSPKGTIVPNQFCIITDDYTMFQSYSSVICKKYNGGAIELDADFWDFSKTTAKYRNMFIGEDTKTIKQKIADGTYKLVNLN